jgi:hypothetical protein
MPVSPPLQPQASRPDVIGALLYPVIVGAVVYGSLCSTVGGAERQGPDGQEAERASGEQEHTGDAGRDGQPQGMKELRRQLLEHGRHWRGHSPQRPGPGEPEAPQALSTPQSALQPEAAPGPGSQSLPLSGALSDRLSGSLSRTSSGGVNAATPADRVASPLTDADPRLSEMERSLLRQQLRESLRRQSGSGDRQGRSP